MKQNQGHSRRVLIGVVILCVSLLLQVAGFVSPGWFTFNGVLGGTHMEAHNGLWYKINCSFNQSCVKEVMPILGREDIDKTEIPYTPILEFQIETCLALASCIVAIVSGMAYRQCGRTPSLLLLCILASMTSGILALIAAGKMGNTNLYWYRKERDAGLVILKFPYSLFLTGIGGILDCIVALLLILDFHISTRGGKMAKGKEQFSSIQMSGTVNSGYQEPWGSNSGILEKLRENQTAKSSVTSVTPSPYAVGGVMETSNYNTGTSSLQTEYERSNVNAGQYTKSNVYTPLPSQYAESNSTMETHYAQSNAYAVPQTQYSKTNAPGSQAQYAKTSPYGIPQTQFRDSNAPGPQKHYADSSSDGVAQTQYRKTNGPTAKTQYAKSNPYGVPETKHTKSTEQASYRMFKLLDSARVASDWRRVESPKYSK